MAKSVLQRGVNRELAVLLAFSLLSTWVLAFSSFCGLAEQEKNLGSLKVWIIDI